MHERQNILNKFDLFLSVTDSNFSLAYEDISKCAGVIIHNVYVYFLLTSVIEIALSHVLIISYVSLRECTYIRS